MKRSIHFRRCHRCGSVTSKPNGWVERCKVCQAPFARFFFFDERKAVAFSEDEVRPRATGEERAPICGFTAYW